MELVDKIKKIRYRKEFFFEKYIDNINLEFDDYEENEYALSRYESDIGDKYIEIDYVYKVSISNYSPQTYYHPEEYDINIDDFEIENIYIYDKDGYLLMLSDSKINKYIEIIETNNRKK